jgi:hypothetical protein
MKRCCYSFCIICIKVDSWEVALEQVRVILGEDNMRMHVTC